MAIKHHRRRVGLAPPRLRDCGNKCCAPSPVACKKGTNAENCTVLPPLPAGEGWGGVRLHTSMLMQHFKAGHFMMVGQAPPYRPRKCLQWRTPHEVYFEEVLHLG